ncbi:hypothetical protein DL770_009776 [Monosporascus sp. CRB-9-2]|nr:hypothetical protein DL770_009776 [Monosporascus sp. CRB-9-2]
MLGHRQSEKRSSASSLPSSSDPKGKEQAAASEWQRVRGVPAGRDVFQYAPLKAPCNFRILQLHWNSREYGVSLGGSLLEASLDSHPEYYALSYTWGDPTLSEEIIIDGKVFKITANCASALRRMLWGRFSRTIWVDSICINQCSAPEALEERSRQVAMMDEIYRHAVRVNVHLGEGNQATDAACKTLKSLSRAYIGATLPSPLRKIFKIVYEKRADDALTPSLQMEATRPEDKVYAFYGICKRLGFELPTPNYQKPLAVIYTEATRAIISYDQELSYLSSVNERPGGIDGLPSWVPDFSDCFRYFSPTSPPRRSMPMRQNAMASGSSQWQYRLGPTGQRLELKGRRLDTICAVGQPWKVDFSTSPLVTQNRPPTADEQLLVSLVNCIGSCFDVIQGCNHCPRGGVAIESMARVLLNGLPNGHDLEVPGDLARYLSVLVAASRSEDNISHTGLVDAEDNPAGFGQLGHYAHSKGMELTTLLLLFGFSWKTLIRTTHDFLGMASYSTMVGDLVVVFHGSSTASVIRSCADGFKYVGPAFVDGIMDGEFWCTRSTSDDELFVLL